MGINEKMKTICDNIRLRTGGTEPLTLDEIAEAILTIGGNVDMAEWVHKSIGATFPPAQLPASDALDGYDIDALSATSDDIHEYIDDVVSGKKTVSKEILGKDASGKYDIARYTYANREHIAWVRENYPKMYAWKNGNALKYTTSVSPRIDDKAYDVPYVQDKTTQTVTVPAKAAVIVGKRYSLSGKKFSDFAAGSAVILPLPKNITGNVTVTLTNMTRNTSYGHAYGGTVNNEFTGTIYCQLDTSNLQQLILKNSDYSADSMTAVSKYKFAVFVVNSTGAAGQYNNSKIHVNGVEVPFEVTTDPTIASQESTTTVESEGGGTPVTTVSATNRSRTIGGVAYVRSEPDDVAPTLIYTDADDSRNSGTSLTVDGITYRRYPLGDLGANRTRLTPVFIYANEHGVPKTLNPTGSHEPKICSVIAARFLRDLASDKQAENPLYKYIRENCMVIVIPVANPFGYNLNVSGDTPAYAWTADGYYNYNGCNINRNYDTPGWDVMTDSATLKGGYPGSQNETQFIMNTMVESGAAVAMSLHGLGSWEGYCAHQGQSPDGSDYDRDKLAKVAALLLETYGYTLRYYDLNADGTPKPSANLPATTSKSPSYITQCGAYGGIVEFNDDDARISGWHREMNSNVMNNAYAQMLNLLAMWLSDHLESQ